MEASHAYSAGATGEGIVVAVIDTGVDGTHPDLQGQVVGAFDVNAADRAPDDIDTGGHGTLVAGVIAARKGNTIVREGRNDTSGIHGVAFEAGILDIRADRAGSCQETGEDEGCRYPDTDVSAAIDYAIDQGAHIINMSLGGEINANPTLENAVRRAAQAGVLVVISAGNDAEPAGTDEDGNPTPVKGQRPNEPAYIAGEAGSLGRVVAVGSINAYDDPDDPDDVVGDISDFSNRAGEASKFYYLLAPGEGVVSTGPDDDVAFPDDPPCSGPVEPGCNDVGDEGDFYRISGTSFAAPYVAGGLALLLEAFPNLAPEDALSVLLDTADDYVRSDIDPIAGVAAGVGPDIVSGVGVMNLRRAFEPQGQAQMAVGQARVDVLTLVGAAPSGAFGDWASESGAFSRLSLIDSYDRAFDFDETRFHTVGEAQLGDFRQRADWVAGQSRAARAGRLTLSWHTPRLIEDPAAPYQEEPQSTFQARYSFAGGEVAFGRGGAMDQIAPQVSLFTSAGDVSAFSTGGSWASLRRDVGALQFDVFASDSQGRTASGIGLSQGGRSWRVRGALSVIEETGSALGAPLQSRFDAREDEAGLTAFSLEGRSALGGGWTARAGLEAASVDLPGLDARGIWTSRWSLGAERPMAGGTLAFTLAQPRRAETGTLSFDGVTGANRDGLVFETISAGLSPSGRQISAEARYGFALTDRLRADITAAATREPNHVAAAEDAQAIWFGLRGTW